MKDGFIRVQAATPDIRVADCEYNTANIIKLMDDGEAIMIVSSNESIISERKTVDELMHEIKNDMIRLPVYKIWRSEMNKAIVIVTD